MNIPLETWENHLLVAAREFPYPPTPDLAGAVRQELQKPSMGAAWQRAFGDRRRLAWTLAAALLVILAALLSIPSVRAAVLEFLQVGAIRIILPEPSPIPTATPLRVPVALPSPQPASTSTFATLPRDLVDLNALAGEITLDQAIAQASFHLRLPALPADLGFPDRVFIQDMGGDMLIFVWTAPGDPQAAELVLYQIAPQSWAGEKASPRILEQVQVHGLPAAWAEGPYVITLKNGNHDIRRVIAGHVLLWADRGVTYRLESNLDLDEALAIAESLAPIPGVPER